MAVCIALCGQSKLAGYVNNKSGLGLIKTCQLRIGEGSNLLVFPEGTRTLGQLGRFKMGFALVSRTIGAPIQTLIIRYDSNFLGKGWPFFQPPPFPLTCSIRLGEQFHPDPGVAARALGLQVEDYIRAALNGQEPAVAVLAHD